MLRQRVVLASVMAVVSTAADSPAQETDQPKHIVIVIAEREYDTKRTLPALAKKHLSNYRVTIVIADPKEPNRLPGLVAALEDADVALISVRRRAPTTAQMRALRGFLRRGGGLVGIRTASHAFDAKGVIPKGHEVWRTFDRDVLGCHYRGHHGNKLATRAWIDLGNSKHPIIFGAPRNEAAMSSSLYKSAPLHDSTTVLMHGRAGDINPHQPLAWIRTRKDGGRVFYTSLGHPKDFDHSWFPHMLVRGIRWTAGDAPRRDLGHRSPQASLAAMRTPEDLAVDLVLSEPLVAQPVFLNFDERGRMWVVQYRQYPHPAGLTITSRDRIWRNVYDRVPPPPPHPKGSPFRGVDRISIHEDTNGDGKFDKSKVFLDGLNMCTAVEHGRGGVWVLNPPYLLFYADRNRDDVPDGDGKPTVHLKGFGLEDSHSIVNSLRFGPDGWLYGAQGSTVTADIVVVGKTTTPLHTQGQQIWRYHPELRVFEVFAEGGGNAFGCEIDAKGRVFSGHNGGDTRGFHYPQGGYLRKGFNKHGPLSNPHAFGFFPHMPHKKVARFTHNFIVYEGNSLPARYRGKLFAIDPINRYVPIVERALDGATFRTRDVGAAIRTVDEWFRPVDIKHGPDGAIYICDWYDSNVNHYRNHEGRIDKQTGRIYRIRGLDYQPSKPFDLMKLDVKSLIVMLAHENRWFREQALRVLADKRDPAAAKILGEASDREGLTIGQLWARNLCDLFDDDLSRLGLHHGDPHVRAWTARLLGDRGKVSTAIAEQLVSLARNEDNPEVRSQLASTAKRLPADVSLRLFDELTKRDLDRSDRYIPLLLWWALESKCAEHGDRILAMFASESLWKRPIVREQILWRLMRRFAATGKHRDLLLCARLLEQASDDESKRHLMDGFEQAFQGRAMTGLPTALVKALNDSGVASLSLEARRGDEKAIAKALEIIANPNQPIARRTTYLRLLAELKERRTVSVILGMFNNPDGPEVRHIAWTTLQAFDQPRIATFTIAHYSEMPEVVAEAARSLLASRPAWTTQLVAAARQGKIDPKTFSAENVARLRWHPDPHLRAGIDKIWGKHREPTPAKLRLEIARIRTLITAGHGDPYVGKLLFLARCATCHKLFADGGDLGPNLTAYKRDDLDSMLLSIVDPSAEIREGYKRFVATMKDGRILVGAKVKEDKSVVVLRSGEGLSETLERTRIATIEAVAGSMMPAGLLRGLSDRQLRDLFAYLRTTQPQIK